MRGIFNFGKQDFVLRVTFCLLCIFSASAEDVVDANKKRGIELEARKIDFFYDKNDKENSSIKAIGDVILKNKEITLNSDALEYIGNSGQLTAKNNVLHHARGLNLNAPEIIANKELTAAEIVSPYIDGIGTMNMTADYAMKEGNVYNLKNTFISTCSLRYYNYNMQQKGEDCSVPSWSLKAANVRYDMDKKLVQTKNVTFRMSGIPLFYLPTLSLSLDENKTHGFLVPSVIYINNQTGIGVPYFVKTKIGTTIIRPDVYKSYSGSSNVADGTSSQINRANNINISHEYGSEDFYGIKSQNLTFAANAKFASNAELRETKDSDITYRNRYYANLDLFTKNKDQNWSFGAKYWGLSDRSFRQQYDRVFENYLPSTVNFAKVSNKSTFFIEAIQYNPIAIASKDEIPTILPYITNQYKILEKSIGNTKTSMMVDTNFVNLRRQVGANVARLSNNVTYKYQYQTRFGSKHSIEPSVRVDVYSNRYDNILPDDKTVSRVVPSIYIKNTIPITITTNNMAFSTRFEPLLNLVYTKENLNKSNIINEDSSSAILNSGNIFANSVYSGLDLIEDGLRTSYGLQGSVLHYKTKMKINFIFAQKYTAHLESSAKSEFSNYVSKASISWPNMFLLTQESTLSTEFHPILSNTSLSITKFKSIGFDVNHVFLSKDGNVNGSANSLTGDVNQITYNVSVAPYQNFKVLANVTQNLNFIDENGISSSKIVNIGIKLLKENKCAEYGVGVTKNNYLNYASGANVATYFVSIRLKGLMSE